MEKIALLLNETDLSSTANDALFDQISSVNSSIKKILDSIDVIKDVEISIKNRAKDTTNTAITKYKELVIQLDSWFVRY